MNGIIILTIFAIAAVLMFLRKLPALLALPVMAIAIALVEVFSGTLTLNDLTRGVIADGALRLSEAIVISMFGGMLSALMQKAGVAESFVRKGAELSGDNPFMVAVIMLAIITLLFTTIGGLGAVIMVGTIVLPILASIGLKEHISGGVILFGITLGGLLNAANWANYRNVLGLDGDEVYTFALKLFGVVAVISILFLAFELTRSRVLRIKPRIFLKIFAWITGLSITGWLIMNSGVKVDTGVLLTIARGLVALIALAVVWSITRDILDGRLKNERPAPAWYSYLIPIVPLVLILLFDLSFASAFLSGLVYGVLVTMRKGTVNMTARAVIEGSASVVPAVVLMIGIGMLLSAILGPQKFGPGAYWYAAETVREWPVMGAMKPVLIYIVPDSFLSYVLIFTALAPLALYRGPLNVWGLGYGVGGILLATGVPGGAVLGILMSLGIIQGVSDPTNTQNVWLANELRIDVNVLMWRTLPYTWIVGFLGLVIAGLSAYL